MRLINWNLSYQHKIEPKIEYLKSFMNHETIVVLQETVPHYVDELRSQFENSYNLYYSLDLRQPSEFDGKERKLGVMVIIPKSIKVIKHDLLTRTPFPERTIYIEFEFENEVFSLFGLHSLTGVDYKKTKSVQFYTFAESVVRYKPDIVMIDANEPKIDHPDINQVEYFDNRDNGKGARSFFDNMYGLGLADPLRKIHPIKTIPLTVSHKVNKKFERRYDYIFVNQDKFEIIDINYYYDKAILVGSDHALVVCNVNKISKK